MGANRARLEDASAQPPTQHLVGATVGDRCATCGAPMAPDQHYCINCGERRGKPRFGLGAAVPAAAAAPPSLPRRRKPKVSSATALVAGVGTLLLAMGVGVLIGRTDSGNNQKAASAPAVQVVTVAGQGGGAAAAPAATAAHATTKAAAKSSTSKTKHATKKKVKVVVTKQQAAKAQAAASKVLASDAKNLPPPTVTQGQKGHGPGFQHGHFTGTFFGQ
jgi:hypothetical protein